MLINHKNRDRKGGHSNSSLGYNEVIDPKTKKLFKRLGNKKLRRQFNKTNAAIQKELENNWTLRDGCHELDMMDDNYDPWFTDELWLDDDLYQ